jgi:hypothetical protein
MRAQLASSLDWGEAHADFDKAVADLAPEFRGRRVTGLPHSAWELLEHLRLAQYDLLDFATNPDYKAQSWPADYWPSSPEPPSAQAWDQSVAAFRRDRNALKKLIKNSRIKLESRIPHAKKASQTYLRDVLLVLDHNAYHVGELVALRQVLGAWPPKSE